MASLTASDVVFVAYPLPNGTQVLMPRRLRPRSCVRLDGVEKIRYKSRSEAQRGCRKHEAVYRCRHCGSCRGTGRPRRRPPPAASKRRPRHGSQGARRSRPGAERAEGCE